jgi:hypothetical protein
MTSAAVGGRRSFAGEHARPRVSVHGQQEVISTIGKESKLVNRLIDCALFTDKLVIRL